MAAILSHKPAKFITGSRKSGPLGEKPDPVWVSICGFNIAILIGVFMVVARPLLGPRRSIFLAVIGVAFYTLLVGASASVVRAAIMASLALIGQRLGRRSWGLNTLTAATLLMTLQDPQVLWDVGFQLTSSATLGILLYSELWQVRVETWASRRTTARRARGIAVAVGELFLITAAAQLTTLPVLIYYFRQFSIVALLANFVILPAQPALEITAGLALVLGMVWLPLGQVAAWLAWPFSAYTVAFVEFFPIFQTPPSPWARPHQRLSSSTMQRCLG